SGETLFTQQVYQILAGYPDCNDAQTLRNDPLFQTLLDRSAEEDAKPLASGQRGHGCCSSLTARNCFSKA
ncbi:MAG: hypothetical protein EXR98_08525, partial [Gemmataceae bacterium]|nr:hypothetical protein [Gemmataceae bacterium]